MFGRKKLEEVDEYGDERGEDNDLSAVVRERLQDYNMQGPVPDSPKEES